MTASYLEIENVNILPANWDALSRNCLSFCRWLHRWHKQTGEVSPKTVYLAYKQGKHKSTVYRWLSQAEAAGVIRRESPGTKERVIVPLADPPKTPKQGGAPGLRRSKNATQNATQNATHLSYIDAIRRDATTMQCEPETKADSGGLGLPQSQSVTPVQSTEGFPPDASREKMQKELASLGVSFPVAVALVKTMPEEVSKQLDALPYRQVKDKAAALVASIKQSWPIPEAFKVALARKQKQAADAQNAALRAQLSKKRESTRSDAKSRFSGLPDAEQAELRDRAASALRSELPAAWKLMQNRPPEVLQAWITTRAIAFVGA